MASALAGVGVIAIYYFTISKIYETSLNERRAAKIENEVGKLLIFSQEYSSLPSQRSHTQWDLMYKSILNCIKDFHAKTEIEKQSISRISKSIANLRQSFTNLTKVDRSQNFSFKEKYVQAHVERIIIEVQVASDESYRLADTQRSKINKLQEDAGLYLVVFVVFISVGIIFTAVLIKRGLIKPISELQKEIKNIEKGNYSYTNEPKSNDELGQLSQAFSNMANNLKNTTISRNQLEGYVEQRTIELLHAKEEAELASKAKTRFLSSMSHELRTPLNVILGFAQLLSDPEHSYNFNDEQKSNISEIHSSGQHLLALITEVLEMAALDDHGVECKIDNINLSALVERCISEIKEKIDQGKHINIENKLIEPVLNIRADSSLMRFVINNFLNNAIKYNKDGGKVVISNDIKESGFIRLSVSDTGIGIGPEMKKRLFIPFERLDFNNSSIGGTGLGLHISKRYVESMHGNIGVESKLDEGSTFWVELPIGSGNSS